MYGLRVISVIFTLTSRFMSAVCCKLVINCKSERIECTAVLCINGISDIIQGYTANSCYRTCKVFVYNIFRDADSFKYLAALIRLDSGDTHLGRYLNYTGKNSLIIIFTCSIVIFIKQFFVHKLFDSSMGKIWIDCRSTESEQSCKMMYFSGLT